MEDINYLRRLAKTLKKNLSIAHSAALDIIAKDKGYINWKDLLNKNNYAKKNN